jgi:hypothetical protein
MKKFLIKMNVKNKDSFESYRNDYLKCKLREEIYRHVISKKEEDYFSLDGFSKTQECNIQLTQKLVETLIPEIEKMGWKCKLSFGNTGLFIYSTDEPPKNCW